MTSNVMQDWTIEPSTLELDPRLQDMLDRHNMSSDEHPVPNQPEMKEKGNPPASLPGILCPHLCC